jgi:hypothetical protein
VGPTYQVQISGLPNKLLTEVMMEAILEQAGLDNVSAFTTKTGKPTGSAVVTFSSFEMVERCLRHFHCRQWDPSGTVVGVNILSVTGHQPEAAKQDAAAGGRLSAKAQKFEPCLDTASTSSSLSSSSTTVKLSAYAPAFIASAVVSSTGNGLAKVEAEGTVAGAGMESQRCSWTRPAGVRKAGIVISSDTSTEVGESEAEDEQDVIVGVAA